jgi:hypothetical protein
MQGRNLEAPLRAELEQIMPLVSALTGLPTRWSGKVELVDGADFKGKKRFTCDIQLNAALADDNARWTTLIHESLHAVSSGYSLGQYQIFPGWEEGVVEQMQRLLRGNILAQIGVSVSHAVLAGLDADHRYNDYIRALEAVRLSLAVSEVQFYHRLLATPLAERSSQMLMQAYQLPTAQRLSVLRIASASNAALKMRL